MAEYAFFIAKCIYRRFILANLEKHITSKEKVLAL